MSGRSEKRSLNAGKRQGASLSPNVSSRKATPSPGKRDKAQTQSNESLTAVQKSQDEPAMKSVSSMPDIKPPVISVQDEDEISADVDAARLALRRSRGRSSSLPTGILRNHLKAFTPAQEALDEGEEPGFKSRQERRVSFSLPNDDPESRIVGRPATPGKSLSRLQVQVERDPLPTGSNVFQQVMAEVGTPREPSVPPNNAKTLCITKKDKKS